MKHITAGKPCRLLAGTVQGNEVALHRLWNHRQGGGLPVWNRGARLCATAVSGLAGRLSPRQERSRVHWAAASPSHYLPMLVGGVLSMPSTEGTARHPKKIRHNHLKTRKAKNRFKIKPVCDRGAPSKTLAVFLGFAGVLACPYLARRTSSRIPVARSKLAVKP